MIDDIDRKILWELQEDARISFAELGRRVGLTTPAVIERVHKLQDAGIITGYRAEIDTATVGLPITAFVRMSITGVDYSHIIEVAQDSSEVLECHRGTGGDSFIMKVAVRSVEHLQEMIDRLTPYGITTTTIVLSSPVKRRTIEVEVRLPPYFFLGNFSVVLPSNSSSFASASSLVLRTIWSL